jgi:Holliday junction DNA helicase RuvB
MLKTRTQVTATQLNEWRGVMEKQQAVINSQRLKLSELQNENGSLKADLDVLTTPPQRTEAKDVAETQEPTETEPRKTFDDVVGQTDLISRLKVVVNGSRMRGVRMSHCLIEAPPGHGKSTISRIISDELGVRLVQTSAPLLRNPAKISELLVSIREPTTLFIDEVHSLPLPVAEILYEAMQDQQVSILTEGGSTTIKLPPLNVCGATTMAGRMPQPFRDRFPLQLYMDRYSLIEIAQIVSNAWEKSGIAHTKDAALAVAQRSRLVPRIALSLGDLVANHAAVESVIDDGKINITESVALGGLARFAIQEDGLTIVDMMVLKILVDAGRYVGLDELASRCDIDKSSIQSSIEPALLRDQFMSRGPRGRIALEKAYDLFGMTVEEDA